MSLFGKKFQDLRVLLADDQRFIRDLIRGMLHRIGVGHIHAAASGAEAMEILTERGSSIQCIVSDWNMAPGSGIDLLKNVRTGSLTDVSAALPFIMLTGDATSRVVTAALNLDVHSYIVKPASAKRLADAISRALHKQWTPKPAHVYHAIQQVELPPIINSNAPDPAGWAKWVRQGQPSVYQENAGFICREPMALQGAADQEASELRNIRNKQPSRIKPGTILVEDFCDKDGLVLIAAGTILSAKIIERLKAMQQNNDELRLWVGQRA
jgi:two-component system, chemotaxis family, chemotaxis protein CheY